MYLCILTKAHCILFEQTHIEDGLRVMNTEDEADVSDYRCACCTPEFALEECWWPCQNEPPKKKPKKETVLIDD